MNILIIMRDSFPLGMARTNRVLSFCKGFIENRTKVKVICLKPTEKLKRGILNKISKGVYNGIEFEYSSGTTIRSESFIKRRLQDFLGLINAFYIVRKSNAKNKISALILFSNSLIHIIYFSIITKLFSITYIQEKSEFPFVSIKRSSLRVFYAKLYTSYVYKAFDAMLVMTNTLKKYFQNKIRKNSKQLIVPMTVETERFSRYCRSPKQRNYIAYCGSPSGNKDGVPILMNAFSIISKKYKTIQLYIIGDTPGTNVLTEMKNLAKRLKIEDKVIFTGLVVRDKVPEYLCNASFLALARPRSIQSQGGFPSKLGEYLSTGNPVIVTRVGEIPDYLQDGKNAFLAEPDSAEAFAEKLDFVLSRPDLAKKVGQKGREVALKYFNYKIQAKKILNFINELNSKGKHGFN